MRLMRCCCILLLAGVVPLAAQTVEELHAMIHVGRIEEMMTKVAAIPANDCRWKKLPELLVEAGEKRNDYTFLIHQSGIVLSQATDPEIRAAVGFGLGIGYWRSQQSEAAKAAFTEAAKALPGSELAARAEGNIHEITHLRPGMQLPDFAVHTTDGTTLSAAELRGKVVLLNFWASW